MSTIAFATADSITITDYDPAGNVHVDQSVIAAAPGKDKDGDVDTYSAEDILIAGGWKLADSWSCVNGQWSVEVERA